MLCTDLGSEVFIWKLSRRNARRFSHSANIYSITNVQLTITIRCHISIMHGCKRKRHSGRRGIEKGNARTEKFDCNSARRVLFFGSHSPKAQRRSSVVSRCLYELAHTNDTFSFENATFSLWIGLSSTHIRWKRWPKTQILKDWTFWKRHFRVCAHWTVKTALF